jgi:DNA primase
VVVPIGRRRTWEEAKRFSLSVAQKMVAENPSLYTTSPLKAARKNKIFLDHIRNDRGSMAVAACSPRARVRFRVHGVAAAIPGYEIPNDRAISHCPKMAYGHIAPQPMAV